VSRMRARWVTTLAGLCCSLAWAVGAEQVTVSGRVVGPDGQGMPDCELLVQYGTPPYERMLQRGRSQADGRFSFEVEVGGGDWVVGVVAQKPGLAMDWAHVPAREQLTLRLRRDPVTCAGTVTDVDGNPIAGATVFAASLHRSEDESRGTYLSLADEALPSTHTDAQGRFEIGGLRPGERVRIAAFAQGGERAETLNPVPAAAQDAEIVLRPEAVIAGRATHEGTAVPGMRVVFSPPMGLRYPTTVTDEDGRYRSVHLPPGLYHVLFEAPEGLSARAVGPLNLKAGEQFTEADVELTPGGLVQGMLTDAETGQPIVGARVFASGPSRPSTFGARAHTDDSGSYTLRLAPGDYQVHALVQGAWLPWEELQPRRREVTLSEGQTLAGVDFALVKTPRPVVRGRVLDPDGEPAAGVRLGILGDLILEPEAGLLRYETDADGRFEVTLNSPDTSWMFVLAADAERDLLGVARMKEAAEEIEVELQPGAYLEGTVVDPAGNVVPDCFVGVGTSRFDTLAYATTNDDGSYVVGPLPAGVGLTACAVGTEGRWVREDAREYSESIRLEPGEHRVLPPLRLNLERRSLRGVVIDPEMRPVRNATVHVSAGGGVTATDAEGAFEVTGLAPRGEVWVVAIHPTEDLFLAAKVDPDEIEQLELILQPLGAASGTVVDAQGRLTRAKIHLYPADQYWGLDMGIYFDLLGRTGHAHDLNPETDEAGRWQVEGLVGGAEYTVYVGPPGAKRYRQETVFTAQPGITVDIGASPLEEE